MGRIRVYYQQDGKISVDHPDQRADKKPENMTNDEWIDAQFNQSAQKKARLHVGWDLANPLLLFDETDSSQLPNAANTMDRKDRDRWRGTKATGIKVDNTVVLRKDIIKDIDDELDKPNPNIIKLVKLQRRLVKKEHD